MPVSPALAPPQGDIWTPHAVRIVDVVQDTDDTRTYHVAFDDARQAARYAFRPGQFNMLYVPGAGEAAISISSRSRSGSPLLHTIRTVGNVTGALERMRVGDTFGLRGPFGSCWPLEELRGQHIIFITGGIGLAPLRPAIYHVLDHREDYGDVALLYGARTPDGLLYEGEYRDWIADGLRVQVTVDRADPRWAGYVGVVTLLLDRLPLSDPANTHVLCCGPEVMMHYTALSAFRQRIPAQNVWISMERNMNCAIGLCGHCQFGPSFLCKDGPVLRYDRVAPFLPVRGL
ncbi:MAG: FAD/NAD(P)-binding protein [Planctomyces sp.]|nr:FAD/NAD(P)-binding protein [Planctomyces sp.]